MWDPETYHTLTKRFALELATITITRLDGIALLRIEAGFPRYYSILMAGKDGKGCLAEEEALAG